MIDLSGKTIKEIYEAKAKEHNKTKLKSFSSGVYDVVIDSVDTEVRGDVYMLKVVVSAKKNSVNISVNNPLYFVNPPLTKSNNSKVNDKDERTITDDPDEALKEIIIQAISR
jgi:hypothetical protein